MAWYINFYKCARCKNFWADEWSCMCDDECPHCGARHMSPYASNDLTVFVEPKNHEFVVFYSPETADHHPDYRELARFPTEQQANVFIASNAR